MVFESKVIDSKEIAKDTYEITLLRPPGFIFKPGQYTQISVSELVQSDSKGDSRVFSIASPAWNKDEIKVVFRDSGSAFKKTLINAPENLVVYLEQASGVFVLPEKLTKPNVFVAGGVGISPFMSYLYQYVDCEWDNSIHLIYGNKEPKYAAYLKELEDMVDKQDNFSFDPIYEQPQIKLFAAFAQKYQDATWWVVGPPGMVSTAINGLQAGGVSINDILYEKFDGY